MISDMQDRRGNLKSNFFERLHDPLQLRIFVMVTVFLFGYATIYLPLNEQIAFTEKKLSHDQKMLSVAKSLQQLQKVYQSFTGRIPEVSDEADWMSDWTQYIVKGSKQYPQANVLSLDFDKPGKSGPYRLVTMKIAMEGSYHDLNKFLAWLESNSRLIRVDSVKMSSKQKGTEDVMDMQLYVVGLSS